MSPDPAELIAAFQVAIKNLDHLTRIASAANLPELAKRTESLRSKTEKLGRLVASALDVKGGRQ